MAEMTTDERTKILARLQGEHATMDHDESAPGSRGASLAPVRRAYGGTRREDRERPITVFNTPFAPDILVASPVMGEGIDLHQECRSAHPRAGVLSAAAIPRPNDSAVEYDRSCRDPDTRLRAARATA